MAVVSLSNYRPSPRSDGKAWKEAKLEGASASTGPWTAIQTFTLAPEDADPTNPASRNFTTEKAKPEQTWVRVTFVDSDGDEQTTTPVALATSAAATDLTTLANVRSFLQKQGADQEQDQIIQTLITQASGAITRYTERQFLPEAGAEHTFEFNQPLGSLLSFAPYELRSVTSLRLDTDTSWPTTLEAEDFRLWPKPNPDGTYLGIRLYPLTLSPITSRWGLRRELTIDGDWGMTAVPDDVVNWCNVTVALWLRRDVAAFETTLHLDENFLERPRSLPSAVKAGLDLYKRRPGP